jgi:DNA-binding transcriptional LysR family regulator
MFEKLFAQSGLSLERLKAFVEIVRAGGFTAAARGDSNRQSQLSRQLKELERYFGAELIRRGRGPAKLTPAGERLYQIIGHSFSAMEEFRQGCANQPVELVIGAGESLIQWLLLPRLSDLTANDTHVTLTLQNLRTEQILKGLADGSIDFGVLSRMNSNRQLAAVPLGKFDYALFLPADLAVSKQRRKFPSQILNGLPLATLNGSPQVRQALEADAEKHKYQLNIRLQLSSYPQLAQAVQTMNVAAIMPTLASQSLPAGSFKLLRLPVLDTLSRQIILAWSKKLAEVRPAIEQYSMKLTAVFRQ